VTNDIPRSDPPPGPDPLAVFRVKRCLKCEYDLAGLPPDHACPECGEEYTRGTLALIGWSQAEYIPGTGMWWLHRIVYAFLWLLGLFIVGGLAIPISSAFSNLVWFAPLGYIAFTGWLFWERRKQVKAGGNKRLLVSEAEVQVLAGPQHRLLQNVKVSKTPFKLGRALRRVRLTRRRHDVWEILLHAGSLRAFLMADSVQIDLRCTEEEAQALAGELRSRIARALEHKEHG
jgi:hypothetical protein